MNPFDLIRRGGAVTRYHTDPVRPQTVGHHSWGVATIIQQIWPTCRKELILAALYHDCAEHLLGDIPAPAKWRFEDLAAEYSVAERALEVAHGLHVELTPDEEIMLKLADGIELMMYCFEQYQQGNLHAKMIYNKVVNRIDDKYGNTPLALEAIKFMNDWITRNKLSA